jgi:GT2 family glycosyltransferase
MAKDNFSRAHFILNSRNAGFSTGNNLGIRFALEKTADFILLLNPDALIEKNALAHLMDEAEKNPQAGLFSPLILKNKSEKVWFAGGQIEWLRMKATHIKNKASENPYATEYLSGCAMLIRKEVFKKIGLLDEDYFLYYEDTDFSWRARKNNFSLLVVPDARVYHFEHSENNPVFKTYWLVFSGLLFFRKNASFINRPWLKLYFLGRKMKNLWDLRRRKSLLAETVKKAYNDYTLWIQQNRKSRS